MTNLPNPPPPSPPSLTDGAPAFHTAPSFAVASGSSDSSLWKLAFAGLLFALAAANVVALWPRWYSGSFLSLAWQASKMIVVSVATGAAAVRTLWGLMPRPPAASPTRIALTLSACWVFLPCVVLLYEANSPSILLVAAIAAAAMALALRTLTPAAPDSSCTPDATSRPPRSAFNLSTLNGLPASDSPVLLATGIAILIEAALLLAAASDLLLASLPLSTAVFLLVWRWSSASPSTARRWLGTHPPLVQTLAALAITALCIIPFAAGHRGGFFSIRAVVASAGSAKHDTAPKDTGSGYAGIILYPPPKKKEVVAPMPHSTSLFAGALAKPMRIPFDGPYWYFKWPARHPSFRAHVAHAKPTEVNVHSTDNGPLLMEAHQTLANPIDLDAIGEIDLTLTNADLRPGSIAVTLVLANSTDPASPGLPLGPQPILSSLFVQIPVGRQPVSETLRFPIAARSGLHHFNQITVRVQPGSLRSQAAAKLSIDSFNLLPKAH